MKINFTGRHADITPDIKKFCEKRVKNLERLLGTSIEADLILSVEKYRKRVEINVKSKRMTMNAAEETHDLLSSLYSAFGNIEKRLKKEREKLRERKRRKNREKEVFPLTVEAEKQRRRVIRSDDYSLKPMSLEEAIMQLGLNKKDIFVFRRLGSEKWAVLYRRKDGHYSLVEPE